PCSAGYFTLHPPVSPCSSSSSSPFHNLTPVADSCSKSGTEDNQPDSQDIHAKNNVINESFSLPPDYVFIIKVLLDECVEHEKRLASMGAQIDRVNQEGMRVTEAERQACFEELESQRAAQYRVRLTRFYQGYTMPDELFTWTINQLRLVSVTDLNLARPDQALEQIRQIDSVR
ncbi:unnamed protein product, partial [Protopolystoma xenopodis]